MWPALTVLLLAALVALHFWWRRRCDNVRQTLSEQIARLEEDRQRAETQAQSQQDALLNSVAAGLLVLDREGRIRLANRAFATLLGVQTDVRGRTILEAVRANELAELFNRVRKEGSVLDFEFRLPGPPEHWLQVNASAIADPDGQNPGAVMVFHDLTRLRDLEKVRQEFVANVSHELRTPLSMIKGCAETLLDGAKDDPAVATKFLQTIERHSNRLSLLIEDLLTISQLESGGITLNARPVALRAAVAKVFEDFSASAAARQVTLVNEMPELAAQADADRLQQVLSNLVDNATKYGRAEGTVTICGRALDDGFVEVHVRDDGPGLPVEAVERVFERFYRVDKARSREQGGTGLGLSIVKHIVQAHGGKVWVKSEPSKGATFFFTLPQARQ
jgi:two-component system phosphate regulon sensor histidine kinase PhoR